jgi:hypothetical protein
MLGLQRPKTISEWLPPVFEQKAIPRPPQPDKAGRFSEYEYRAGLRNDKRSVIQQFIHRIDYATSSSSTAWNFKISLVEPLSQADQVRYDGLIDLVGTYQETGDRSEINAFIASGNGGDTHGSDPKQDDGTSQPRRGANETGVRRGWNALNSLNRLLNLLEKPDLNSTNSIDSHSDVDTSPQPFGSSGSVVVVDPYWDLSVLFAHNPPIRKSTQQILLEQNASPNALDLG